MADEPDTLARIEALLRETEGFDENDAQFHPREVRELRRLVPHATRIADRAEFWAAVRRVRKVIAGPFWAVAALVAGLAAFGEDFGKVLSWFTR